MKNIKLLIFTLLLFNTTISYAAFILEGEQEVYNFTPSDFSQTSTTNSTGVNFSFSFANSFVIGGLSNPFIYNGHLELGEIITLDFYENQGDATPFNSYTLEGQAPEANAYIYVWSDFLGNGTTFIPWLDLEGSVVVTSLIGEVELSSPNILIYDNEVQYSTNLSVVTVPLPSSLLLILSSLLPLLLFRRNKLKHNKKLQPDRGTFSACSTKAVARTC